MWVENRDVWQNEPIGQVIYVKMTVLNVHTANSANGDFRKTRLTTDYIESSVVLLLKTTYLGFLKLICDSQTVNIILLILTLKYF